MGYSTNSDDIARDLAILRSDIRQLQSLSADRERDLGNPTLRGVTISDPIWSDRVIDTAFIYKTPNNQFIEHGTTAAITWDVANVGGSGGRVSMPTTGSTISFRGMKENEKWLLTGFVTFSANSSGARKLTFKGLNSLGAESGSGDDLVTIQAAATASIDTVVPFSNLWITNSSDTGLKIEAVQYSGSSLEVRFNSQINLLYLGRIKSL